MALIDIAIEGLKAKSIREPRVLAPPTQGQIAEAEARLSLKFPPSFLTFLSKAGSYALSYWETYWVGDSSLGSQNIVEANRSEHEDVGSALPPFLVTFHNNGCGDQLCFDTRKADEHGEYSIVFWDHERTVEDNLEDLSPVADSFADWLMQEVDLHD
jgi:SMI1-KNR4 cell-wall